jgi:hypothetical protein
MAGREDVRRIHNLVLAAVVSLAVLALTLYGVPHPR